VAIGNGAVRLTDLEVEGGDVAPKAVGVATLPMQAGRQMHTADWW